MNYILVPAKESPPEAPKNLDYCLIAIEPFDNETIKEMKYFHDEFGPNSENYLMTKRTSPSRHHGLGSGTNPVTSYIELYFLQGHPAVVRGFLFRDNIKDTILNALEARHNINMNEDNSYTPFKM
jgi:hypothetical protein